MAAAFGCRAVVKIPHHAPTMPSPELAFQADTRFDQMDRTRELLRSPAVRRDIED